MRDRITSGEPKDDSQLVFLLSSLTASHLYISGSKKTFAAFVDVQNCSPAENKTKKQTGVWNLAKHAYTFWSRINHFILSCDFLVLFSMPQVVFEYIWAAFTDGRRKSATANHQRPKKAIGQKLCLCWPHVRARKMFPPKEEEEVISSAKLHKQQKIRDAKWCCTCE